VHVLLCVLAVGAVSAWCGAYLAACSTLSAYPVDDAEEAPPDTFVACEENDVP